MVNLKNLLKQILKEAKPSDTEISEINETVSKFNTILESCLKKNRISAQPFIGGSIAKSTIIRKNKYDIDVFVRLDYNKYKDREKELGVLIEKSVAESFSAFKNKNQGNSGFRLEKVHGSRDYFNIFFYSSKIKRELIIEIVPTLSINKPEEARNITDLSFFHVRYVLNELRKKNLSEDIILAKAFCYANNCYGAESYIKGFSGYAIELLVLYYGGFEKFIKKAASWNEKVVIDPSKKYKNENDVLVNINESKLQSPVVVVDPTFHLRNACAAVSNETFRKFVSSCKEFIGKPSANAFKEKKIDEKELAIEAIRRKRKFSVLRITSKKEREDIAASKIVKFIDFIIWKMKSKEFEVLKKEVEFLEFRKGVLSGKIYLLYKEPESMEIVTGPPVSIKEHAQRFKRQYKNSSVKKGILYAKIKRRVKTMKDILFLIKKGSEMKNMSISSLEIVK